MTRHKLYFISYCQLESNSTFSKMLKIVLFLLLQVCFNQAELEVKICGNLRYGHTMGAAVYDNVDHIWFLGGYQLPLPLVILDTVVRYDVNTYESEIVRRFPYGIYYGAAEIDGNGEIFHFGGTTRERRNEIFNFNETNARPRIVNYFADGVNAMSAVTVGKDTIFLFGGNADPDFDPQAIYLYNTTANTLRVVARLPISLHSLAPVYDGKKVYIFGGMENGVKRFDIYKFDPAEFTIETLDLTTSPNFPISTAQYVGNNQSILIGYNSSGSAYFARFHHSNETLEDLHVNSTILTKLDNPSSAYVPKTNKIYFHGDDRMISSYSTSVYCLELSAGNSDITCPSEGLHFLPHPTNCSLYYVCNDGKCLFNSN